MSAGTTPLRLLFVVLTALAGGCASSSTDIHRWTREQGGLISGSRQDRAEQALARLTRAGAITRPLTVAILDTDQAGAFGWRSGTLFVTRGLIDLLDDEELAAAVAHEAGHLLADGHLPRASALDGCAAGVGEDSEMSADALGRTLLRPSSVPDDAMIRLLNKLARHPTTPQHCRDHLHRRIARLTASPA